MNMEHTKTKSTYIYIYIYQVLKMANN